MTPFNFTADQQMALDFPGNVIVSAGAGSGKTRVLVEKYFRMLVDEHPEWPVDAVVAITFTRKAAAELKSRIIKRVLDELELETEAGSRRSRLRQLRSDVGAAPIGTIHNFCGRILKEFSFDAHLNPDFLIVEGAQEGALRMTAARDAIATATADSGGKLYNALLALLNVMSASALSNVLAGMLAGRASYLEPSRQYVEHSLEELFNKLSEFHSEYVQDLRRELGSAWIVILRELDRQAEPGKLKDITSSAVECWPEDSVADWSVCSSILEQVIPGLLTGTFTCRKSEFKKAGFEEYDQIRSNLEVLVARHNKTCLDDLSDIDRDNLELSRKLAFLFLKTVEIYEDLRGGATDDAEAELLDYADLEILAEKLVSENASIQRQIQERYRFLIMDEFQDTSQSQWNIVKPLVLGENGEARPKCLFVVGDKKQGVYGFRDANVTLFAQVHDLVTASNEEWENCRGAVSMAANFRTSEAPLNFINRVFNKLLTSEQNAYGVEFEALTVQRSDCEGRVEFLLSGSEEETIDPDTGKAVAKSADEKRHEEAELVASHIKQLIDTGEVVHGQIALLFRKRSVFSYYEAALRERRIPVVTQQGFNLFQQPELADMVAALNAVVYPHKDVVLVHYFRSPAVGFTDDLLLKISRTPGRSFWDKTNRVLTEKRYRLDDKWLPLGEMELECLSFALEVLQETRTLVGRVSPYNVVRHMMDALGFRMIVKAGYRGEQAVANLDKLLTVARSAESLSFEDFLEYVKSEGQSDKGTTEAADLTSSAAVKIMTIHAAKGLEFPVVYLPDLNSGTSGAPRQVNGDGEHWMTFRLPRDLMPKPSFLMDYFKLMDEKKGEAEERRVFYVAMTRCEQRLVLSANREKQRAQNTFYSWITDEFEQGRGLGLLVTPEDIPQADDVATMDPPTQTTARQKAGRELRIDAALRAAVSLGGGTQTSAPPRGLQPAASELNPDVLREFLPLAWNRGVELALQEVETTFAMEFAEEFMGEWHRQLREIFEWMKGAFTEDEDVLFFSSIRLITPLGVKQFKPHVASIKTIGYAVLPGAAGDQVRLEVARMRNAFDAVPDAPELSVYIDEMAIQSAAPSA